MRSRTLILIALGVIVASGVLAGSPPQTIDLYPSPKDTTDLLRPDSGDGKGDTNTINDTIAYTSRAFGLKWDFDRIMGRIVQVRADTCTAADSTGTYALDSVYFQLQTKMNHYLDSAWHTLWTSGLIPVASMDSNAGSWGRGAASFITLEADSMDYIGDLFRIRYYYVAEEDSIRQETYDYGAQGGNADSTIFWPYVRWQLYIFSRMSGGT